MISGCRTRTIPESTPSTRAGDIDVVYREVTGNDENGQPIYKSKRAKLSELLARLEGGGLLIQCVESSHSDPRKLMLDAIGKMHGSIDQLAKLTGAYQKKQENQYDRKRKRLIMPYAIQIAQQEEGTFKSLEEIDREIDRSIRNVERVWAEAERRAIADGLIT